MTARWRWNPCCRHSLSLVLASYVFGTSILATALESVTCKVSTTETALGDLQRVEARLREAPTWPEGSYIKEAQDLAETLASISERLREELSTQEKCVDPATERKLFWKDMKKRGLKINLKRKAVTVKAQAGLPEHNRTTMVLSDDVYYGRAIVKIPRRAILSLDTIPDAEMRAEVRKFLFEDNVLQRVYNLTEEDNTHLLNLAYPLIAENRKPGSLWREWLDGVQDERIPTLELTERQRSVLVGTTVEGSWMEMEQQRSLIEQSSGNFSFFRDQPVTREEAGWALAVIMRKSRIVHPHQDVRDDYAPRMQFLAHPDLNEVALSPDAGVGIPFQEEMLIDGKREEECVIQIARRDMPKGEEVFLWPGRLSNSELLMRHNITFDHNPIGIGRNATTPPNWSPNKEAPVHKEYAKYNCSDLQSFELRFSPKGWPMRQFVRCFRISWFLNNGWYNPGLIKRMRDLDKWPPPSKYGHDDWLAWTQANGELNNVIKDYCKFMRTQLKNTITVALADDFRSSTDPMDKKLWRLRDEESKTFKACITLADSVQKS